MSDILLGGVGTAGVAGSYPASIVTTGLQTVYDYRVGGSGAGSIGPRSAYTKVLGVDTLPAGFTYSGGFLRGTGTASLDNWDLSALATGGQIYTDGTGTVTFNDCLFKIPTGHTGSYNVIAGDSGTPTTVFNYCKFDGNKAIHVSSITTPLLVQLGTCQVNNCDFINAPGDSLKQTGGSLTIRNTRFQACGWDDASDPDMIQCSGGTLIDVQNCLFDPYDGSSLGASFTGQGQNNYFRAEASGSVISSVIFKNNVCMRAAGFSSTPGIRQGNFVSIDARDVNPNAVTTILYQNNAIEKGTSDYTYNTAGTTRNPHLTSGEWTGNYDFLANTLIAVP